MPSASLRGLLNDYRLKGGRLRARLKVAPRAAVAVLTRYSFITLDLRLFDFREGPRQQCARIVSMSRSRLSGFCMTASASNSRNRSEGTALTTMTGIEFREQSRRC